MKPGPLALARKTPGFLPWSTCSYATGGSTDIAKTLLRGIKERSREELQYWGPRRIRLWDPVMLEEPLLEIVDREEVEKWEHVDELKLWMKHALGLTVDIVANDLSKAFFIRVLLLSLFCAADFACVLISLCFSQDLKETSQMKSGFIHATKRGWEQVPILKQKLLKSQEKLLKSQKGLIEAVEEQQKKGAALTEALKTLTGMNGKIYRVEEDAQVA